MDCGYFDAGRCRSCTLMGQPYPTQLAGKQARAEGLLAAHPDLVWLDPVASPEAGYRNKAKMVVGGTADAPTLGILGPDGAGVDLRDCGVLEPALRAVMPAVARFVTIARLVPYDVPARRGELKNVLVTASPTGELLLRLVLRSTESLPRIRKHLPALLAELPQLSVVSANLLPEHRAVVEGVEEIPLTERRLLRMPVGDADLLLRPQGFFQTNSAIAAALYREAASWAAELPVESAWDLYSGVGGFAIHLAAARPGLRVTGVETSEEAVAAATEAAGSLPVSFVAGDATAFALAAAEAPDLVVVNPPRRGIGAELAAFLEGSAVRHVLYSSCNPETLATDLARMPSLRPVRARMFDMFPQTEHSEVLALLERA